MQRRLGRDPGLPYAARHQRRLSCVTQRKGNDSPAESPALRRRSLAQLVRVQAGDRPPRLADVAELDEAMECSIDVLPTRADHPGERALGERDPDHDTV